MNRKYNKLVRDKIPSIVEGDGQTCVYEVCCSTAEMKEHTRTKVLEEALEVSEAVGRAEILAEMADLYEVIVKYGELYDIKPYEILQAAAEKESRCGKFNNHFILKEIRKNE